MWKRFQNKNNLQIQMLIIMLRSFQDLTAFRFYLCQKKLVKLQAEIISKKIGERGGVVTPN